jgi:IclR family transcriptional regulator, acetate operon repressor
MFLFEHCLFWIIFAARHGCVNEFATDKRGQTLDIQAQGDDAKEKNLVPVIERMLDILDVLALRSEGVNIRQLCDELDMPRSTVYRILNTLEIRDMVRRGPAGAYILGPHLLSLSANVLSGLATKLLDIARVQLAALSRKTGEASKLSVRDEDRVLVVAVISGSGEYGLSLKPGRRLAFHAGAASKMLLAHLPSKQIERICAAGLPRFTSQTIIEPAILRRELEAIRRQGWALDHGEHSEGVFAVAAPILDGGGQVIAAISIPFLSTHDQDRILVLRQAVMGAAKAISDDLAPRRG